MRGREAVTARRLAAGVATGASLAGCWLTSSFSGLGGASGDVGVLEAGADASEGGGGSEAGGSRESGSGGSSSGGGSGSSSGGSGEAGPGNLLENPGFEQSSGAGCGPGWMANLGTIQASSVARSGKTSCMLCPSSTAPGSVFEILYTGAQATGPASLQAGAWFRFAPGDAGAGDAAPTGQLQLGYAYGDAGQQYTGDTPSTVTGQWQPATTNLTLDAGNESAQVILLFAYPATGMATGGCVLIDDMSLFAH